MVNAAVEDYCRSGSIVGPAFVRPGREIGTEYARGVMKSALRTGRMLGYQCTIGNPATGLVKLGMEVERRLPR